MSTERKTGMNKKIVRWSYLLKHESLETLNRPVLYWSKESVVPYAEIGLPLVKITLEVVE